MKIEKEIHEKRARDSWKKRYREIEKEDIEMESDNETFSSYILIL